MSTNIFTNAQMEGAKDKRFEQKYNYLVKLLSQMINTNTLDIDLKEDKSNKVTSISGASTDVQYPSAKLLYDQLATKQAAGNELSALQALADTAGFVKKTGDAGYSIDTATYTNYTDEMAQDAVGGMVDTTLTYTDGTPELKVTNPVAPQATGFTISAGTTPKTLTVPDTASVSGTNTGDNSVNTRYEPKYGGMYAYDKAIPFNITVADTYHAFHLVTAGDIVTGVVSGFTFNAGRAVDANITSEASGTGGLLRIVCSAAHGLTTGDLVVLGNMNDAGHNLPTRITTDGTNPTTEFLCDDILYVAGAGVSAGIVDEPAYLKASSGSAGVYHVGFTIDGTAAAANKTWKFELNINITQQDNVVSQRTSTNTMASMTSTGHITIAENDKIWLSGKNVTDTSDYTVKNYNLNLFKM